MAMQYRDHCLRCDYIGRWPGQDFKTAAVFLDYRKVMQLLTFSQSDAASQAVSSWRKSAIPCDGAVDPHIIRRYPFPLLDLR